MIKEIYLRNIKDPYYDNILEHSSDTESIIQQVKMILGTENGQVLGDYNFGVNLKKLIFQTSFPQDKIENLIQEQISQYINYTDTYSIQTKVSLGKSSDGKEFGVIDIIINQEAVIGVLVN